MQVGCPRGDSLADLDYIVNVALGISPARDRKADQLESGGSFAPVWLSAKHDRTDLAAADPASLVERHRQGLAWVLQWCDVRHKRPGVDVDGVAADRKDDRDAAGVQRFTEVSGRPGPVAQVIVRDSFGQTLSDRLEVTAGEPPICRETFGQHK